MIFRVNGAFANTYAFRLRAALGTMTAIATISVLMPHVPGAAFISRASAQDLIQYLDLTTDEFTKSNVTRAEIEAGLAKLQGRRVARSLRQMAEQTRPLGDGSHTH